MILIDVLDDKGNPTGDKMTKQEIHIGGFWHKAAHVWIYNSKNEILLQLRAKDKDSFPGLLDISAAGHVDSGETPEIAAIREIKEETDLNVKTEEIQLIDKRTVSVPIPEIGWQNNEIDYVYLYKFNGKLEDLSMPDGEVEEFMWKDSEELLKEISDPYLSQRYVPHGEYYNFIVDAVKRENCDK